MIYQHIIDPILFVVGFVASVTDTIAGGGGLITLPVLLFSGLPPVLAFGTNKFQSVIGQTSSTLFFLKKKYVNYKLIVPCFIFVIFGSTIGTIVLLFISVSWLEKLIPILLTYVLIQMILTIFIRKNKLESDMLNPNKTKFMAMGTSIGFYNGFFGPGTGSLWAIMLMKFFHINIKSAIMYTKPLNLLGNISALIVFIITSEVNYTYAIIMAVGAYIGGKFGGYIVSNNNMNFIKMIFFMILFISTISTYFKYY
ncbi:TSUP family transporter [Francisella sp. 19X1-34]|uniref:sulfite exporter TauE/SafE family protein n=1 Tax=Francisella sp. 19X1-34 TaxID=3087177 RepID=UPI002E330404|nr:TSUP family transporter [Francisella sp. 19X1-34]MED7789612.1 TSUP family transporter [Francisella sp. 19X1-34]